MHSPLHTARLLIVPPQRRPDTQTTQGACNKSEEGAGDPRLVERAAFSALGLLQAQLPQLAPCVPFERQLDMLR